MKSIGKIFLALMVTCGFTINFIKADKEHINTENNNKSGKNVTSGCSPATSSTDIELNNVRARIHTGGDMWWDLQGTAKYEVPKNSGKTALFAGSIWIGGVDVNNQLKIAAQRFRQDGIDYWPGPLITEGEAQASVTPTVCRQYDKHFVVSRNEVSEFRAWFNADEDTKKSEFEGYSIPTIIQNWPAHGDYVNGYPYYLAPFFDNDGDGYYDPGAGDYPFFDLDGKEKCGTSRELRKPRLYGDQTLWWVYNDKGNIHTETGGDAIGMELHGQAFAFSTNDELNNMTFYNYEIINRSTYTLKNTYFGVWTDADMGDATDDYVGCDVNRGLGYLYNGDAVDGSGQTYAYGENPPAVGVDFFEGPYQDADEQDNLSNWDADGKLDCANGYRINPATGKKEIAGPSDINNGNINGLNFGDNIDDNERWGMRRYIYFNNPPYGTSATQDPHSASDHYNYLLGVWKDGTKLLYGGTGHTSDPNATDDASDFMFPGKTDKCNWGTGGKDESGYGADGWTEKAEQNQPGDRRFVQSAGPFTLEPGMVNDITTGVVWARSLNGDNFSSVVEVQKADDKAQKLFEACFKVLDGPDAPELDIIEMDKQFIFHVWNKPTSNNYLEKYVGKDPFIVCPLDQDGNETDCDKFYKFQGYQVFQLKEKSVSISDIHDVNKARLVYQCDLKDGVAQLVNFEWSDQLQANVPTEEVYGKDAGISHTFTIKEDYFATGNRALVNHKKYYYLAIAYAYNNFKKYDQTTGDAYDGQKLPYKAGRKGADGSIKTYEAIPHIIDNEDGGTILNAEYGDVLAIEQLDGFGGANNILDLEDETINQIMSGSPWNTQNLKYKTGYGPIVVKVIDPLNVPTGDYTLRMCPDSINTTAGEYYYNNYFINDSLNYDMNYYLYNTKWIVTDKEGSNNEESIDTINSESWISLNYEQLIPELGLSITIEQVPYPFVPETWPNQSNNTKKEVYQNGALSSSIEYSDETKKWLSFLPDDDSHTFMDWIKAGTDYTDPASDDCNSNYNDRKLPGSDTWMDPDGVYEKLANGGWAPYRLVSSYTHGPAEASSISLIKSREQRLANVNIVITSDKSKWTRCPVLETTDNDYSLSDIGCTTMSATVNSSSKGGVLKLDMRKDPSVDKDGNPDNSGTTGMGWFPGYAIDIETGERLNLMFGESTRLVGDNGADMKWNPSSNYATDLWYMTGGASGEVQMGGKHFIYILGHNVKYNTGQKKFEDLMKPYDEGDTLRVMLDSLTPHANYKRSVFMNCMWVGVPIVNNSYDFLACDVTIKLRVVSPYRRRVHDFTLTDSPNSGYPMYNFSTKNYATSKNNGDVLSKALDLINIVPNPYYAHDEYELTQIDNLVKITNLPEKCTVSIYSVNGTLIRRYEKDSPVTYIEWDLKNSYGITISSGVYVIHVQVPDVGERVIKWFGALRPIDLNAF